MRLQGKVVVVTGTGSGIGKDIAERFALEGAKVVAASRRASTGQGVVDAIVAKGGDAIFIQTDISSEADVTALFDAAVKKYGRIDGLVNNAGVNFVCPFEECTPEAWDRVLNVDLRGTYLCCRRAILEMLKTGDGGSIINVASNHTMAAVKGAAPYDAAKWGMVGLTKSLGIEFASRKIRVNVLSPGLIHTQIWDDILNAAPSHQECNDHWNSNIPMHRVGTCAEISSAAVFMISDESTYMTGANLVIDGGTSSQLVTAEPYESKKI
ncbi:MAG: SDR family oxidoreductase [Kiritimatiellales bacterium]|nr:SDR family oxidoreductase [Kiritimatiellales bacterium]MCF7863832.1 SDR family oxidoreductase [Kiritimatiellales bacterium]